MRALAARLFTFSLMFALTGSGCGVNPKPCSAPSCAGCCDEGGECLAGTGLFECGAGGAQCARCAVIDTCRVGSCQPLGDAGIYDGGLTSGSGGGSGAGGSGGASGAGGGTGGFGGGGAAILDAGKDDGVDAGRPDAGADAGKPDAGFDAGIDAGGRDAGIDGGRDAGDAG